MKKDVYYFKRKRPNKLKYWSIILLIGVLGLTGAAIARQAGTFIQNTFSVIPETNTTSEIITLMSTPTLSPSPSPTIKITAEPSPEPTPDPTPKPSPKPTYQSGVLGRLAKLAGVYKVETIEGFVNIRDLDNSIVIDMRYAGSDNIMGKAIYNANVCITRPELAEKLLKVQKSLKSEGYGLKIWDAYRPSSVQAEFLKKAEYEDGFALKSNHCLGLAVDVSLVKISNGQECKMPSDFDDFANGARNSNTNLKILTEAMISQKFIPIYSEWWHYSISNSYGYKSTNYVDFKDTFAKWNIIE